jgi:hypothetical protein
MSSFLFLSLLTINTIIPSDTCSGEPARFFSKPKTESEFKNTQNIVYEKIIWASKNPGSICAKGQMSDIFFWIKEVPYLSVPFNSEYMPAFSEHKDKYEYYDFFFSLFLYSQLLYMRDNEHNGTDDPKMINFALNFALNSYSDFIKKTNSEGYKPLNELLTIKNEGKIDEYIAEKHKEYEAVKQRKR